MCEASQRYNQLRRRSDSLSLTVFQWSSRNKNSENGSVLSLESTSSNSDLSPNRIESPDLINRNGRISDSNDGGAADYHSRQELFRGRSISGSSLDSVSRSIATQTPTEDLHFIFPDTVPQFEYESDYINPNSTSEEPIQFHGEPRVLGVIRTHNPLRHHSFYDQSVISVNNVPRTKSIEIPSGGHRTLSHSLSYSYGVKVTSSVGQELRSIGDDFDRIGGRTSHSLASLLRFSLQSRRRGSTSY